MRACVCVSVKVRPIDQSTRITLAFTTKTIRAQYRFGYILRYFADAEEIERKNGDNAARCHKKKTLARLKERGEHVEFIQGALIREVWMEWTHTYEDVFYCFSQGSSTCLVEVSCRLWSDRCWATLRVVIDAVDTFYACRSASNTGVTSGTPSAYARCTSGDIISIVNSLQLPFKKNEQDLGDS